MTQNSDRAMRVVRLFLDGQYDKALDLMEGWGWLKEEDTAVAKRAVDRDPVIQQVEMARPGCTHEWRFSGVMPNTGPQVCRRCGTRRDEIEEEEPF